MWVWWWFLEFLNVEWDEEPLAIKLHCCETSSLIQVRDADILFIFKTNSSHDLAQMVWTPS